MANFGNSHCLRDSRELDQSGQPLGPGPGLYGQSRSDAPRARFHGLKTCKVRVTTSLRAGGGPVAPAQAITAARLMAQLHPLARVGESAQPDTPPPAAPVEAQRP